MEVRSFGSTGVQVSILGLGAGNIGDPSQSEDAIGHFLNLAVDHGIRLIDSARSYGLSEERIGRHLSHRRNDVVLSTKVGYGIPGYQDWTGACITAGIEQALRLFRTDRIDIAHLHSCPLEILQNTDVMDALLRAVGEGKVRVAAYSGDNEPVEWAARSGKFGSIQTSVNICDQYALEHAVKIAEQHRLGIIAKRSLANVFWRFAERPSHEWVIGQYWDRWKTMGLQIPAEQLEEISLRFAAYAHGIHSSLVGTSNPDHLLQNIQFVEKGPLPEDLTRQIRDAFAENGQQWNGLI